MTNYPTPELFKQAIVHDTLEPLRVQQPISKPIRYATSETGGLLTAIKETAILSRVVVAHLASDPDTHPRDVAINIMEQWAKTGDQLRPEYDIMGDTTITTAQHRLKQYQERLSRAVNPKRPLLLIEGYDQLSIPVALFLIPVILMIATHTSHNQLPGAVIMSGQENYGQLSNDLRPITLSPHITEDSIS
jgi:hypothetical protein